MHEKSDAPVSKILVLLWIATKSILLEHFLGLDEVELTVSVANFVFVLYGDLGVKEFDDLGPFAVEEHLDNVCRPLAYLHFFTL